MRNDKRRTPKSPARPIDRPARTAPAPSSMCFEDVDGLPVPRPATRRPDGKRFFDLDGAARHFRVTEPALTELWEFTVGAEPRAAGRPPGDECIRFEDVDGQPVPRFPVDGHGAPVVPDGRTLFDLAGAAAHFNRSPESMRRQWAAAWGSFDLPTLPAPAAAMPDCGEAHLRELLAAAHATGTFGGVETPDVMYGDDGRPSLATVTVHRIIGGSPGPCAFVGVARYEEFHDASPAWRRRPAHELARCALVIALEYAFTEKADVPAAAGKGVGRGA